MGGLHGRHAVLWLLLAIFALIVLCFRETASSLVAIWSRTGTFGHGFLIPPIAAWLVWRRRDRLAQIPLTPSPMWVPALALCGFAWLTGRLGGALILEQGAFALLIPLSVGALLGTAVLRALTFPLFFLLLGVPFGDWIIPQLIEFTALFTVHALRLSGVPVARLGPYLAVPNAEWVVSDACSGFRYLMASFTLGCLYAQLRLRTWPYRLFFVTTSLLLPIVANGFRAYMIVMLGYMSNMKLTMGVDHFIYGWVVFAVLCLLLFWIGSRLREPAPVPDASAPPPGMAKNAPASALRFATVGGAAAIAVLMWPLLVTRMETATVRPGAARLDLPATAGGWSAAEERFAEWRPNYSGAATEFARAYRKGERTAAVYVAYYRGTGQGAELINSQNTIVSLKDRTWRWIGESAQRLPHEGRTIGVVETRIASRAGRLLLWHYFWLGGSHATNPFVAQFLELRERLLTGRDDAALVILFAPYERDAEDASADLRDFHAAIGPALAAALRGAAARP